MPSLVADPSAIPRAPVHFLHYCLVQNRLIQKTAPGRQRLPCRAASAALKHPGRNKNDAALKQTNFA